MANVDKVNGFTPVRAMGSPWNGETTRYVVLAADTTIINVGDLVVLDGGSDGKGIASVTRYTTAGLATGVCVGVEPDVTALNTPQRRVASTLRYIYVVDNDQAIFEVQEDGTMGSDSVMLNAEVTLTAGSTVTGSSGMEITSASTNTTASLVLKILGAVQREDNDATLANAKWLVKINAHSLGQSTGAIGKA